MIRALAALCLSRIPAIRRRAQTDAADATVRAGMEF